MEIREALERIDLIHAQVARTSVFRGYKAATVGCTGMIAILASVIQPFVVPHPMQDIWRYVQLWSGVAALSVILVAVELATRYRSSGSSLQRAQTVLAIEHLLPCLLAGACVTWVIVQFAPMSAPLLPGLWAILFSLGVFATCRQLPDMALVVALFYLIAGVTCMATAHGDHALSPWAMAGTFGAGQLLTAAVLYATMERTDADS